MCWAFHTARRSPIFMKNDKKLCTQDNWNKSYGIPLEVDRFLCTVHSLSWVTKSLAVVTVYCSFVRGGIRKSHLLSNSIYVNGEIIHFNFHRFMPRSRTAQDRRIEWSHSHNAFASCLKWKLCKPTADATFMPLHFETVSTENLFDHVFLIHSGFDLWFFLDSM